MKIATTRLARLFYALILVLASAAPTWADSIGYAVGSVGSSTRVGNWTGNVIDFYIPLSTDASGVYGSAGAGTSPDLCSFPGPGSYGSCGTGFLQMFLRFDGVQSGLNLLTLDFNDLDLGGFGIFPGVNDPWFFLESVSINDGSTTTVVNKITDPAVVSANLDHQILQLQVNAASNPFYVGLYFGSNFVPNAPVGDYMNTPESVLATVKAVPEPSSLLLFGFGVFALALTRGYKSRTQSAC